MSDFIPSISVRQQDIQSFAIRSVGVVLEHLETDHQSSRVFECDESLHASLVRLLAGLPSRYEIDAEAVADRFATQFYSGIVAASRADFNRYPLQDPALSNVEEIFFASNGFWATVAYRVANALRQLGVPIIPRAISSFAHSRTGIDIHPGATIAAGLFIDHGTGIAIGCTAVIGENVNLYNGVVLGTRSKPRRQIEEDSATITKRHPTIERGVSLYTNAFVGGDVTVGENAVIGAYAFVCRDVAEGEIVSGHERDQSPKIAMAATDVQSPLPKVAPGVLGMIGSTPMVEIKGLHENANVRILAKLEGANPGGSVKDRIALSLIEQGEASGKLTHDKIILESTSGNTGIGLAMVGAAKGYKVVLTMSSAMSEERKKVLRAFGATLIETDPTKGTGGAIEVANRMMEENPDVYWMSRQHSSLDNPLAHYESTAQEILKQAPGITHFVAGIGTFGTLRGAGIRLREEAGARVIGVEPELGQSIQGLRNMNEPNSPALYDESLLDLKLMAKADGAYRYTRMLAETQGLLVGMSSGAAMQAAVHVANVIESGTIVVLFPDRGEKYLSTPLFDIPKETIATAKGDVVV